MIFKKYCILSSEGLFTFTNSVDPDEMHFIWVFSVCKFTRLGVSQIQRGK